MELDEVDVVLIAAVIHPFKEKKFNHSENIYRKKRSVWVKIWLFRRLFLGIGDTMLKNHSESTKRLRTMADNFLKIFDDRK